MSITWRISDFIYTKLWLVIAHPCLKFTCSLIKDQYNQGIHILQRDIAVITYIFWSSPIRFNWKIISEKSAILSGSDRVKFGVGWVTIKYINISVVTSISCLILVWLISVWKVVLGVPSSKSQHWFRLGLGTEQASAIIIILTFWLC